jgi:hypothetical protein
MYSGVFKSRRVNASIAMGSAFFGNADSSYRSGNARRAAGAVSTTDYDRQSDVAPAYDDGFAYASAGRTFCPVATPPVAPLNDISTDRAHSCDGAVVVWFNGV